MNTPRIQMPAHPEAEPPQIVDVDAIEDAEYDDTMTEERAERIIDDVHRSREYARARKDAARRRRGRPALDEHGAGRVSARVTGDQRAALERIAAAEGVPVSQLLREAVDEYLTHHQAS